ncbi:MAG TPA: UbiA family prenyltransferase, partial [Flavisolibacter sp.]
MSTLKNYLSLIKFSHTIFAMPFALIGFFLGLQVWNKSSEVVIPGWHTTIYPSGMSPESIPSSSSDILARFGLVLICMITARSAAMAFNRFLDRRWDALNPRTAIREIPKGIITPKNALTFTIISCVLFITATFFINRICFYLSPVALAVVLGYSYTK